MKLADLSIRRAVLAAVMNAVLMVVGLVSYPRIGVDLFPDVEFPVATVTTIYPGADPEAVESKVSDKLEEAINPVNGIKVLRSVSLENISQVVVQFELERDAAQATQDVRDKVAAALPLLPADVEPPVVEKFDVAAAPIMALALAGDVPLRDLTKVAEDVVKARLQKLPGVGAIDVVGGREREIHVLVDRNLLSSFGLAVSDVAAALGMQNIEIPGGRIEMGQEELAVKTKGEVDSPEALGAIVITARGGATVRVRDVAEIIDSAEERRSTADLDGTSAVSLLVRKQSGSNTVAVAEAIREELADIELPASVEVDIPVDNSVFVEASIHEVQFDLLFGAILTVLVIMVFLRDLRATLISAVALPTSVIATFGFIGAMGFTFNNMTMLALTLSIGILIDDAIVVIENIHRHLEAGKPPRQAAREATAEIGPAVVAITLSILAVFLPVAAMRGMIGRFFYQFGLTVGFAISVSLFVSFTLTPMLSSRILKTEHRPGLWVARALASLSSRVLGAIDSGYRVVLGFALRQRVLVVISAIAVFAASLGVLRYVDREFLPHQDRGEFSVVFELPSGASLATSERFAEDLRADLRTMPGATTLFTTIGGTMAQNQVNKGTIHVELVGRDERSFTTTEAIDYARKLIGQRTGAIISVEPVQMFQSGAFRSAVIQYNIRGQDFDTINAAASELMDGMRELGGYVDIDSSFRGGKPELNVQIDRDRAADMGVPVAAIASTIRTLIAGTKATDIAIDGDRIDVLVRMKEDQRRGPEDIRDIKLRASTGQLVELSNLVTIDRGHGPGQIERQDRQRQVSVFANLEGKPLGTAITEIEALAEVHVPAELTSSFTGMGEVMGESFDNMILALVLAILLVYLILAAQFESLVHPFTIMLTLPLSTIGAFGALFLFGMTLNILSMIGLIMLMGLVTKNAVLLVDYTNVLRTRGLEKTEALLRAGPVRLRPILMTTAAMIFGMLPVALGRSLGGEMRAPMAIAVIGGLITSTLLSLVVVPVTYSLLDRFSRRRYTPEESDAGSADSDRIARQ